MAPAPAMTGPWCSRSLAIRVVLANQVNGVRGERGIMAAQARDDAQRGVRSAPEIERLVRSLNSGF